LNKFGYISVGSVDLQDAVMQFVWYAKAKMHKPYMNMKQFTSS